MRRIIAKDNSNIYYQVFGVGKPIVLIHGNFQHHRYFKKQIAFFSRFYKVIAMDTRDQGKSNNLASELNYTIISDDLALILQQEHIKKCAIIGFSDGANIAFVFACRYPSTVHKLVLCSGNITFHGLVYRKQLQLTLRYMFFRYILHWKRGYRVLKLSMMDVPVNEEKAQRLKNIEALVIVGEHDIIRQQETNRIVRMLPNVRYHTVFDKGHTIQTIDAAFIVEFLKGCE